MRSQWEAEKERAANEVVVAYKESEAFNGETTEFFISGFEPLRRRALRIYPDLDLSVLKAEAKSNSVVPEPKEEVVKEQEKDDATSWSGLSPPLSFFIYV